MTKVNETNPQVPMIPVIPRDVAEAIDRKRNRTDGLPAWSNGDFIEAALRGIGETQKALRSIPFDTLMAALINGYEVEKTPEELAEIDRQKAYETIRRTYAEKRRRWLQYRNVFEDLAAESKSYADGIRFAVRTLKLDIPEVAE